MNKFKEQPKTTSWKLSTKEKSHMRNTLRKTMAQHPVKGAISSWQWWHISPRLASLSSGAVMILIILMGGTAYAAQGSLPGDFLYPVKIHITEPVQLALAVSPKQKAQVNADIAAQRVEEAQILAARGTLTATTTQELQDNFNQHAAEAIILANNDQPISTTTATSTTPGLAAELPPFAARLNDSLNAQDMILKNIAARVNMEGPANLHRTGGEYIHMDNSKHHKNTSIEASTTIDVTATTTILDNNTPNPENSNTQISEGEKIHSTPDIHL